MNFNAQYIEKKYDEDKSVYITFKVNSWADKQIIQELQKDAPYRLKLAEIKSKRTIEQNNLMWALIHEISVAENGERASSEDDWEIYLRALERAQARFQFIQTVAEAMPMLKQSFRAVKVLNQFTNEKGNVIVTAKVFYGSSKMDIAEMQKLIETVLDMAAEHDIEIKDYQHE